MIIIIMLMKAPPEKRKELFQTITSLTSSIRTVPGCRRCNFFHGMEDKNILCLLEEWDTRKHLETYRQSDCFKVLQGAMNLLEEPCEIISYSSPSPGGNSGHQPAALEQSH